MKNYKNLLTAFALTIFLAIAGALTGCEGPEGPAGPEGVAGKDGAAGKDGKDASIACATCHADDAANANLAFAQFNYSLHATGETWKSTSGRAGCGDCHSGDGFVAWTSTKTSGKAGIKPIDCKTCHPIHSTMTADDWGLRVKDGFNLIYKGDAADASVDFKTGNICATCHQARTYARGQGPGYDTLSRASATAAYSRFGPHYGTVANVFAAKGLNLIEGTEAYPTNNPHNAVAKGCVGCHMGSNPSAMAAGGHSFKMTAAQMSAIESCKGCHSAGIPTTKATEIKALLAEYRQLLMDKGFLYSSTGEPGNPDYNVLGEYAKLETPGVNRGLLKADADVLLNYLYIAKDRSNGAHNPAFTLAILKNGVAYLKK